MRKWFRWIVLAASTLPACQGPAWAYEVTVGPSIALDPSNSFEPPLPTVTHVQTVHDFQAAVKAYAEAATMIERLAHGHVPEDIDTLLRTNVQIYVASSRLARDPVALSRMPDEQLEGLTWRLWAVTVRVANKALGVSWSVIS